MQRRGGSGKKLTGQSKVRKAPIAYVSNDHSAKQFDRLKHDEALEQLSATSEVLKVISSFPRDLQPVFDTMLAKATELCEASYGAMWLREGDALHATAIHGDLPQDYITKWLSQIAYRPGSTVALARAIDTKRPVQIDDLRESASYVAGDPLPVSAVDIAGIRTLIVVPMLKNDAPIGAIAIYRKEVRPFTDKQVELVANFAAQAVIAIENTRLLNELRQRTGDLTESLEQQTATSEVLRIIAKSPQSVQPVFDAIVSNAARLCEATFSAVAQFDGELLQLVAVNKMSPEETAAYRTVFPRPPNRSFIMGRAFIDGKPVHVEDIEADPDYDQHTLSVLKAAAPYRTYLGIPILRDGVAIGVIGCGRREVKPFTEAQIALVMSFADQAVIAIENTRLLNELRQRTDDLSEALAQQTATSEVLSVISRSATDVQPVFETIAHNSVNLCGATYCVVFRFDGEMINVVAYHNMDQAALAALHQIWPMRPDTKTLTGRTILGRDVLYVADVAAEPNYTFAAAHQTALGIRTFLGVPMLREGQPIGSIALFRREVKPFSYRQIELVKVFADQAVIAIENVRLFETVEAHTRELAKSLEDLRATQDRLIQTQKLASLGQLTAGIAHEIKNPLNFVNNFSGVSAELIDELQEALKGLPIDQKARVEINELTDTLQGNLDKVVQHGKRADAIVKNMLLHSREGSGEHRVVDINVLVQESLSLAWHGARAEKQGFDITLERSVDPTAGKIDVFPQDITRALLNLISNGFYAATKRKAETNGGEYVPTLSASTKSLGDRVEIRIRDNGTGLLPEVKEKMFDPFFTTKPAGEGTGLGLSITHDIIVKQHGGSIEVDTQPGEFTEIRVVLPRTASFI